MYEGQYHDRLLAALAELPQGRASALASLAALLTQHGEGYATISFRHADGSLTLAGSIDQSLEPGTTIPPDGIVALVAREGRSMYLEDAPSHPNYRAFSGATFPVELALPIFERGAVTAVLNIERDQPLSEAQRRTLEVFAGGVGHQLTQASHSLEAHLTSELSSRLTNAASLEFAADAALKVIAPAVGATSSLLLTERQGRLRPVAHYGDGAAREALAEGTPYPQGFAWNACLHAHAQFSRNYDNDPYSLASLRGAVGPVVLAVPVGGDGAYRTAITLHYPDDAHVSAADVTLLTNVGRHLSIVLFASHASALQASLIRLYARVLEAETDDLYQQVLDTAVLHVPGAERGSLLVRKHHSQPFEYVAVRGFDLEELRKVTFTEQHMRNWYAYGPDDWQVGRTRILRSDQLDLPTFSRQARGAEVPAKAGELEYLKSTASLPVPYQGRVLAMLNLDNFTREDAFAEDSLSTLALFGPALSSLLAGAQYRDEIVRASRTDTLTGLANREGFQRALERQHARSLHAEAPYTVLSMDLTGFKAVNDKLGHAAGDLALVRVAEALEMASRPGDTVSRWGGDEFVALLPDTTEDAAAKVCVRFQRAVSEIEVDGLRLGVDIGTATFGENARTIAELLKISDARMYANKNAGRGLVS